MNMKLAGRNAANGNILSLILLLTLATASLQAQVSDDKLRAAEARIEKLVQDSALLSRQLNSMEKNAENNRDLKDSVNTLRREVNRLNQEKQSFLTSEIQYNDRINSLVLTNAQHESVISSKNEENQSLKANNSGLESRIKQLISDLASCNENLTKLRQEIATFGKIKSENALLRRQQIDELFNQAVTFQKQVVFSDEQLSSGAIKTTSDKYLGKIDSFRVYFNDRLLDSSKNVMKNVNEAVLILTRARGVLNSHFNKQDVDAIALELRKIRTDQFSAQSISYINSTRNEIDRYCFMHREALAVLELISDSLYSPAAKIENLQAARSKMLRYKYLASELEKKIKDLKYQCKVRAVDGCR
jgi:DNA repair exonuclease SbcCD ATPase subunit